MAETTLDPKTTAVVLIDLQHGILQRQLAPYNREQIVEAANRLTDAARAVGASIIYVQVSLGEAPDVPVDRPTSRPQQTVPPQMLELVPELHRLPEDHVLLKRQRGAFYGTDLEQTLRRRGIQTIIIGGVSTNIGVESTAREAHDRRYALVFAQDAMSSSSPELHQFAVDNIFPMFGQVRTVNDIVLALQR
ncbi:isochorismatase family protein [Terriglobus sp.]|uniref:isochorismatase family protein n=1 Tax=Terriglobus sp. TaxID=1889013 RepID=UPI003B00408C